MPHAQKCKGKELTRNERRERRHFRREKQRKENIGRASKMHAANTLFQKTSRFSCARMGCGTAVGCLIQEFFRLCSIVFSAMRFVVPMPANKP